MSSDEAKETLALFRPGTADELDPSFQQARQFAKTDPKLAGWFEQHCQAYLALRGKFQAIPIPPDLQERILAEGRIRRPFFQRNWGPLLAVAAVVALLIGIETGFWPIHGAADRYSAYRKRMTETALRRYTMDFTAPNVGPIREFLRQKNAPADFSLPPGLNSAAVAGCVVCTWQGGPVAMLCFKSGRPLARGDQSDLWLFVTERKTVTNPPAPGPPVFARVNKATTASWSDDRQTYLLAAVGDETFLRRYLP
ncbi:MAG: hypothetical protein ABSG04_06300 [Verrucomicrobiota bacterium]